MFNKKFIFSSIFIVIFMLTSCSNNEHSFETNKPIYNTTATEQSTVKGQQQSVEITITNDNNIEQENMEHIYNIDFYGLSISQDTPNSANSPYSNTYLKIQSFITYDDASDILYYVDYGNDNFLYSYKNGEKECLIKIPVNSPVYSKGNIYFLSNEDIEFPHQWSSQLDWWGNLYKYNIENNTVELITEGAFFNLSIYDDYIYFCDNVYNETYRLLINNDNSLPEKTNGFLPYFYGEYQLKLTNKEEDAFLCQSVLELVSDKGTVKLGEITYYKYIGTGFCIADEKFWFIDYSHNDYPVLTSVDLQNGIIKMYEPNGKTSGNTNEKMNNKDYTYEMSDIAGYVVLDEQLYVYSRNNYNIFKYDENEELFIPVIKYGQTNDITGLFTDGNYIYATRGVAKNDPHFIVKFIPLENGNYGEVIINK